VEQPLELLVELVGLVLAQVHDPGPVARQRRHLEPLSQDRLVDLVELELEEDQIGGDGGQPVLDIAVELGVLGIGCVAGVEQAGIGAELADQLAQALVGDDRLRQGRAVCGEPDGFC
jgi:hypothetical protein